MNSNLNILLTGLVAGVGCGLLLALGLAALDSSLKTPDQAEMFARLLKQISAS